MDGIIGFCKFLWSGSINPQIEKSIKDGSLDDGRTYSSDEKVKIFTTTVFTHDKLPFTNFNQLKVMVEQFQSGQPKKTTGLEKRIYTHTIHNQVTLTCPDMEHYAGIYEKFHMWAWTGWATTAALAAAAVSGLFAGLLKLQKANIFFLPSVCLSSIFLLMRANKAKNIFNIIKDINPQYFISYANTVTKTRVSLYKDSEGVANNNTDAIKQAASPSEIEVLELFHMNETLKGKTPLWQALERSLKDTPPLTPELQAITAYLKEVTSSAWVSEAVASFTEAIEKQQNLITKKLCIDKLNGISNGFSIKICLMELDSGKKGQSTIKEHLKTYLESRLKGEQNIALPTGNELTDFVLPVREKVRIQILKAIQESKIRLDEIPADSTCWKTAGLNPVDFSWVQEEAKV